MTKKKTKTKTTPERVTATPMLDITIGKLETLDDAALLEVGGRITGIFAERLEPRQVALLLTGMCFELFRTSVDAQAHADRFITMISRALDYGLRHNSEVTKQ